MSALEAARASQAEAVWKKRAIPHVWSGVAWTVALMGVLAWVAANSSAFVAVAVVFMASGLLGISMHVLAKLTFWIGAIAGWDEHERMAELADGVGLGPTSTTGADEVPGIDQ